MDEGSFYKHIDSELPDPDRTRQLIILCAARASLPAPREGKDPPNEPSEKGAKLLQGLKDNVLRLLAERKIYLNATSIDRPGSPANGSLDVRPNEQNVNNRARTTRFKDEIRMYVILICFFLILLISIRTAEQSQRSTILRFLPRSSGEGARAAAKRQGQASCHARRRSADIGVVQAFPGGRRSCIERLGEGCRRRARSSQPPVE